jgi:uncharacterized phiE125 gp8 family phage protein
MLTVITPTSNQDLATLATVKAALGIADSSEDTTLPPLITRASAAIAKHCNRVLLQETVEESLRDPGNSIMLARYPVNSITTVTEDGTLLVAADYEADPASGVVERIRSDRVTCWARGSTVIRYQAGYPVTGMPPDIVQALVMLVAHYRAQAGRDPLLRAEETRDIERLEYFIPTQDGLSAPIEGLLTNHRKPAGA